MHNYEPRTVRLLLCVVLILQALLPILESMVEDEDLSTQWRGSLGTSIFRLISTYSMHCTECQGESGWGHDRRRQGQLMGLRVRIVEWPSIADRQTRRRIVVYN